jgi:hypothetical protein
VEWVGGLQWITLPGVEPYSEEIKNRSRDRKLKPVGASIQTNSIRQIGLWTRSDSFGTKSHSLAVFSAMKTVGDIQEPSHIFISKVQDIVWVIGVDSGKVLLDVLVPESSLKDTISELFVSTSIEFTLITNDKSVYEILQVGGYHCRLEEDYFSDESASEKTKIGNLIKIPRVVINGTIIALTFVFLALAYILYPGETKQVVEKTINNEEFERQQAEIASQAAFNNWYQTKYLKTPKVDDFVSGCLSASLPSRLIAANGWDLTTITCSNSSIAYSWRRNKGSFDALIKEHPNASLDNLESTQESQPITIEANNYPQLPSFFDGLTNDRMFMVQVGSNVQKVNNIKNYQAALSSKTPVQISGYIGRSFFERTITLSGEKLINVIPISKAFESSNTRPASLKIEINGEQLKWELKIVAYTLE